MKYNSKLIWNTNDLYVGYSINKALVEDGESIKTVVEVDPKAILLFKNKEKYFSLKTCEEYEYDDLEKFDESTSSIYSKHNEVSFIIGFDEYILNKTAKTIRTINLKDAFDIVDNLNKLAGKPFYLESDPIKRERTIRKEIVASPDKKLQIIRR